jgi:hypothetical protein
MNEINTLQFSVVLKREYKKWKNKYYSAKSQNDYEKMERCYQEMQKILKYTTQEGNQ